ncbi:MAG: D-glucuronyl C5-epimerase family protein [Candidatus Cloacimonetes bacterium]|nr:D-glucuronyl C5-epimerase family protein [Candidatus Cloacimonadota bacterium]MCF7813137.1 D-glucuronyl C5-epimerase family protein [Candidatus Cloacimonadota bacterium]MCF7867585.1 D-glucuronyl C5-epimerase family protein [Candidatus Cloacimonadota bacterium]MCF7883140.1 D-glucuronyl C5-epimerase family protein [Candidatus Cloacimonadota bacterium]
MNIGKLILKKPYKHFFVSQEQYIAETDELSSSKIKHYYVHPNRKYLELDIKENYRFDKNGIPVVSFPGISEDQYNPVTIAQYALAVWELELPKSKPDFGIFLKLSNWFIQNHENGKWQYLYEDKISNLPYGWISGMAQGQGISVLLRAYSVDKKKKHLEVCDQAIQYFQKSMADDGVAYKFEAANWWFEEYPNPNNPGHVFNGHIFALFGIWDHFRITRNENSKLLFDKGVNGIIDQLEKYDNGWWALYDQRFKGVLNASYLDLQIRQLEVLNAIRPEPVLQKYIARWKKYLTDHHKLVKLTCKRLIQKLF